MEMLFKDAIKYVIGTMQKIPNLVEGLKYYPNGFKSSIEKIQAEGTHVDMSKSEDDLYSALGVIMWVNIFISLITFVTTVLFTHKSAYALVVYVISHIISLGIVYGLYFFGISGAVYIGKKHSTKWEIMLVKLIIIGVFVLMVSTLFSVFTSLGAFLIFGLFSINTIITTLLSLCSSAVFLLGMGVVLDSINKGVVVKNNQTVTSEVTKDIVEVVEGSEESEEDETFEIWGTDEEVSKESEDVICSKCNEIVNKNTKFCPNCGNKMFS